MVFHNLTDFEQSEYGQYIYQFSAKYQCCLCCGRDYPYSPYFHLVLNFVKPLYDPEPRILSFLSTLVNDHPAADVLFLVQGETFKTYSVLVKSASPKMAALLKNPDKLSTSTEDQMDSFQTIVIDNIAPHIFRHLLSYIYTGTLPQLEQEVEGLLKVAHTYEINDLKDLCEVILLRYVNLNSAIRYFILANVNDTPDLKEASLSYFVKEKEELWKRNEWKEFMKTHPDLFFHATLEMMH
jgi:speckle-type POZ protein